MRFQGLLADADETLCVVTGDIRETQTGMLRGWEGELTVLTGQPVTAGQACELTTDQGLRLRIGIQGLAQAVGGKPAYRFRSKGPPIT